MKNVFAFGLFFALLAMAYDAASATTYTIHVRNASDTPIEFALFQKAPGISSFAGQTPKQSCVQPKEARTAALDEPAPANREHPTATASIEIEFRFKSSTCEGSVISTQRLEESNPGGTYTITGSHGRYTISH
jgi:hypothetical protein